jgi:hypothetical protein
MIAGAVALAVILIASSVAYWLITADEPECVHRGPEPYEGNSNNDRE